MPEYKPFDYGAAVASGQQNALRQTQMMDQARNIQGQNMLGEMAQQGVSGDAKYNALSQAGRPDLARQEQAKDMQMQSAELKRDATKLKYFSDSTRRVFNQQSLDAWRTDMYQRGLAAPGELDNDFSTYDESTQNKIRSMRGEAKNKLYKLTTSAGGNKVIDTVRDEYNNVVSESKPYVKVQRTAAGDPDWQKKTLGNLEEDFIDDIDVKDKLTVGMNFMLEHTDLFDLGSRMTAGVGNWMEHAGIDAPTWVTKEVKGMANLERYTLDTVNTMRKAITGAQASFKELDKFILPLIRKASDGKTRAFLRMQGAVMFNEMSIVRKQRLLREGYKVVSKPGDRTMKIIDANGETRAVEDVMPMRAVETYNQRKNNLMNQMLQGKKREEIPPEVQNKMFEQAMEIMSKEGYTTDIPRKDWVK